MTIYTATVDQQWPNGEMPLVIPGVWASKERLLNRVDQAVDAVNHVLRGHVLIRARHAGDRDYVRLHVSTDVAAAGLELVGRQGGVQKLRCTVQSVIDPSPTASALVHALCRSLGVFDDCPFAHRRCLTPQVIDTLMRVYP